MPRRFTLTPLVRGCVVGCAVLAGASAAVEPGEPKSNGQRSGGDWLRFGYDPARRNVGPVRTGITRHNVARLLHRRVELEGTVDSSPVYLRAAVVNGRRHDVFLMTTTYGRALAVDADSGRVLWRFTPPGYSSWAATYRITTASPVVDPSRRYLFSAAPDGRIYKLVVATGKPVQAGRWPTAITRAPTAEKISSPLNTSGSYVVATTSSFNDRGQYQGHVVVLDRRSGRRVRVWNALCSDRPILLEPDSCSSAGAGIWARSGVVVQAATRNLLLATSNGVWDGRTAWSSSVVMLSPGAGRILRSWTPREHEHIASRDLDLGSTAPALLSDRYLVQGGKDGGLRVLDLRRMQSPSARVTPRTGGEMQRLPAPGGDGLFSTPAVWRVGGRTWLFAATGTTTAAYTFERRRLVPRWRRRVGGVLGTSPVVAGGLLYVYDTRRGALDAYVPTSGRLVASLPAGKGHWNSPIITDSRIALPEGDANAQFTTGFLNIYSVPR